MYSITQLCQEPVTKSLTGTVIQYYYKVLLQYLHVYCNTETIFTAYCINSTYIHLPSVIDCSDVKKIHSHLSMKSFCCLAGP